MYNGKGTRFILFTDVNPKKHKDNSINMIAEAEADGDPMDADEIEYEMRKANHWATIGIGVENYYG